MTEEQAQPARGRASVAARAANGPSSDDKERTPSDKRAEEEHTPVLPQGFVSNYAEGVTNTPVEADVRVVEPGQVAQAPVAAAALMSKAPEQMVIAAPAPLPRPGDENLTRGTEVDTEVRAELEGVEPVMPLDPRSAEARKQDDANRDLLEKNEKDAIEDWEKRQEAMAKRYAEQQRRLDERQAAAEKRLEGKNPSPPQAEQRPS
jgi:hypothetical protein